MSSLQIQTKLIPIAYPQSKIVKMQNKLQNQGRGLTAKTFPSSTWERLKEAKETKSVSIFSFCLFLLLSGGGVEAQRTQNITLSPRFSPDPTIVQGVGGGAVPISQIAGRQETANGPCVGFTDSKADHNLVLTSSFNYLSIQVESRDDTTLIVRGPGGVWCNDDFRGKNPGLAGQWLPGTYEIWVGSYAKDKQAPYVLRITSAR